MISVIVSLLLLLLLLYKLHGHKSNYTKKYFQEEVTRLHYNFE